jgi:quinoprotein glucose dehydrogenase
LTDTIEMPSVNGGAIFFNTAADPARGIVYVQSKDVPSIVKLVPAGESTSANAGASIPARDKNAARRFGNGAPLPVRIGRTLYDQSCQACHGPTLKGERGPQIDTAVSRLGADAVRATIANGKGGMPPFPSMKGEAMTDLIAFLTNPESAPPGSGVPGTMLTEHIEPDYPPGVNAPPSRYKTGYGSEGFIITPPWSTITAYDLNTGKIMWQTPYGDLPQAGPSDKLRGNVYPRSGFVVLASGLIVFGDNAAKLYALDKNTGKVIFTKDMPNGAIGVPAVYEVNGREYILFPLLGGPGFPAGAKIAPGGVNPPPGPKVYVAVALPANERVQSTRLFAR